MIFFYVISESSLMHGLQLIKVEESGQKQTDPVEFMLVMSDV